jgi:hypothetical protein
LSHLCLAPAGTAIPPVQDFRHIDHGGLVFYIATTPGDTAMNITFEEVLYETLYEVMEQAWESTEHEYQALTERLENE